MKKVLILIVLYASYTSYQWFKPELAPKTLPSPLTKQEVSKAQPKVEASDVQLFQEIEKSHLPEVMKKQIKEDLQAVDVDLNTLPFNEGNRVPSADESKEMALVIDLIEEVETEMNKGEFVDWSEEDKKIMNELNQQ